MSMQKSDGPTCWLVGACDCEPSYGPSFEALVNSLLRIVSFIFQEVFLQSYGTVLFQSFGKVPCSCSLCFLFVRKDVGLIQDLNKPRQK